MRRAVIIGISLCLTTILFYVTFEIVRRLVVRIYDLGPKIHYMRLV